MEFNSRLIINLSIAVLKLSYAGYCWIRQGVHVRGKGWQTRENAPKSFWFSIILYIILGIGMLVVNLVVFRK